MKRNQVTQIGLLVIIALALVLAAMRNLDKEIAMAVITGSLGILGALRNSTTEQGSNNG